MMQHFDDRAVDCFAAKMKEKLAKKRAQGHGGWDDPNKCNVESLSKMLHEHVLKGDPIDIANFCMMIYSHAAQIAPVGLGEAKQSDARYAQGYSDGWREGRENLKQEGSC